MAGLRWAVTRIQRPITSAVILRQIWRASPGGWSPGRRWISLTPHDRADSAGVDAPAASEEGKLKLLCRRLALELERFGVGRGTDHEEVERIGPL